MPSTKSSSKSKAQEKITPVIAIGPVSGSITDVQGVLTQVKVDVEKDLSVNEQFVDDNATFLTTDGSLKVASALSQVQRLATNWHNRSRKELFYVLSKCYDIYQRIEGAPDKDTRSRYVADLKKEYDRLEHDSESKQTSHRVVAVVFRHADMDRRQRSKYASVLKKAREAKKTFVEFIPWLEEEGGINAVANRKVTKPKKRNAKADLAVATTASAMGAVSLEKSGQALTFNRDAYVLLAVPSDNDPSVLEVKQLWGAEDADESFVEGVVQRYAKLVEQQSNEAEGEPDSTDTAADLVSTVKEDE